MVERIKRTKEIDERVKISVEESRCELHTQPRFASAHFFLYRLAKQRRKIERDNRLSATRLFLNLRAANVRVVPTTFAYPGSCLSLVQLPLRSLDACRANPWTRIQRASSRCHGNKRTFARFPR